MRSVLKNHITARRRKETRGIKKKPRPHVAPRSVLENGQSHPPSHSVTAIEETAIMAEYSARKNRDQRKPLYSVWNPAVSSDSASGKSNGARLVSATIAIAKMKNPISPSGKNLKMNHSPCASCACTMPIMLTVPLLLAL